MCEMSNSYIQRFQTVGIFRISPITPMLAEQCLVLSYPSFIETTILHVVLQLRC